MFKSIGTAVKSVATGVFNRTLSRLTGAGIPQGDSRLTSTRARWSGRSDETDWRVRLQVPASPGLQKFFDFENNELLKPLAKSNGMFWPLTPVMQIQHSANYNALAQTHSNLPFQAYQNSQIDAFSILGEFPVQNSEDAKHWVATVNFLRTVTKMFFGKDDKDGLKGNPPPILHLYGYGDHMFNKIPVVVSSFNVEMRQGIDYISTKQNTSIYETDRTRSRAGLPTLDPSESQTWAPTLSNISVMCTPVYSRESMKNFSMKEFVQGKLIGKDSNKVGFI